MLGNLSGATRIFPVLGDPIAQVKSPYGVTRAFEKWGADAICVPLQVASQDFRIFVDTINLIKNIDGIIITVPHKFAAYEICKSLSPRAKFLGSVNAIRRNEDGSWHGDMFDGLGFVAACKENGCIFHGKKALLIGAGGAGTAIAHAVADAGVSHLSVFDKDYKRRDSLVDRLVSAGYAVSANIASEEVFDIVLNATPMGMHENDPLPVPVATLNANIFVGDVVTKPDVTQFIIAAQKMGCKTSTGSAMFEKVRDLMVRFLLKKEHEQSR